MKKTAIYLCLLLVGLSFSKASIAKVKSFPATQDYIYPLKAGTTYSDEQARDMWELQDFFERSGLTALNGLAGNGEEFFGVDQIFARAEDKKVVFLLTNVEPEDSEFKSRLLEFEDGYLFHAKSPAGVPYALFFDYFDEASAQMVVEAIEQVNKTASLKMNFSFIPEAQAQHKETVTKEARKGSYKAVKLPEKSSEAFIEPPYREGFMDKFKKMMSALKHCGQHVLKGAFDRSFLGLTWRTMGTVRNLGRDPGQVWANTRSSFGNARDFITGLIMHPIQSIKAGGKAVGQRIVGFFTPRSTPGLATEENCRFLGEVGGIVASIKMWPQIKDSEIIKKIRSWPGDIKSDWHISTPNELKNFVSWVKDVARKGRDNLIYKPARFLDKHGPDGETIRRVRDRF